MDFSDSYSSPLGGSTPGSDEGATQSVLAFWTAGSVERDLKVSQEEGGRGDAKKSFCARGPRASFS